MAFIPDFPSNCSTNTFVLPDFGEVAYIVCTVSIPPSSNAQPPSPASNLARIKHTEKQFREASILAVLDPETLQLFTFYKKVDVLKDQRALLSKFTSILRSNSCTIAYKAAARVPDILKREHTRLYKLFMAAILANVKISVKKPGKILPLGQSILTVYGLQNDDEYQDTSHMWSVIRMDTQLIASGHVVLSIVEEPKLKLISLQHFDTNSLSLQQTRLGVAVVLAPVGHLAVYKGGYVGSAQISREGFAQASRDQIARLETFHSRLLAEFPHLNVDVGTSQNWVELELPLRGARDSPEFFEESSNTPESANEPETSSRTIMWPADMCFVFGQGTTDRPAYEPIGDRDSLQFIQSWIDTAEERVAEAASQPQTPDASDQDDEAIFGEEAGLDNANPFTSFGPPAFPGSQTVYPTPPDVLMTHATPGMSSIDGIVATPMTQWRPMEQVLSSDDHEMVDEDPEQAGAVGSGFYDDDLFDEMSEDGFEQSQQRNEPNWDFFDKPDNLDEAPETIQESHVVAQEQPGDKIAALTPQDPELSAMVVVHDQNVPPSSSHEMLDHESADPRAPAKAQKGEGALRRYKEDSDSNQVRRRSSVYESISPLCNAQDRDTRYQAHGDFWFDRTFQLVPDEPFNDEKRRSFTAKSPSTTSRTDTSSSNASASPRPSTSEDDDAPAWTKYERMSPTAQVAEKTPDPRLQQIQDEAEQSFALIKTVSSSLTLSGPLRSFRSNMPPALPTPEARMMLAQTLLDQLTQSSLFRRVTRSSDSSQGLPVTSHLEVDTENLNSGAAYASLAQLSTLVTNPGSATLGRTSRILDPEVVLRRADKLLSASTNIVPFWDTLGLQPYGPAKSIVAFCLHPPGTAIEDGCISFLGRLSDAYASCNLGTHRTGQLRDVTSNGLVPCTFDKSRSAEFVQLLRKFVETLGNSAHVTGNIVIYIVSPSNAAGSLIMCVSLFLSLFKSLGRLLASRQEHTDLVLQIVPASFLASSEKIVVPSQQEYYQLALELYSRVPPDVDRLVAGRCDYPMVLSRRNANIKFNLEPKSGSPHQKNEPCLHLAYAFSDEGGWLVASWTDDRGSIAHSATYQCRSGTDGRQHLLNDLWDVSRDLMQKQRSRWRLVVCRPGRYDPQDVNAWATIWNASGDNTGSPCAVLLVTAEVEPMLRLSKPMSSKTTEAQPGSQGPNYGTPAATPQAVTTSPEQFLAATPTPGGSGLNAPTPPDHGFDANTDSDISLIGPAEESWSLVLPYGIDQGRGGEELREALSSGSLVKRKGVKDDDGTVLLGVHLIHVYPVAAPAQGQHEEALEEVIKQFRGLVALAALRGCIDKVQDCIPWHLHTAVTGAKLLGNLL